MDITVAEAQGIPDKAYLSVRAGDVRKQAQFKPGVTFDLKTVPKHFVVDIFEKVGSKLVNISDLTPVTEAATSKLQSNFELYGRHGSSMKLSIGVNIKDAENASAALAPDKKPTRHEAALKAQQYLDGHAVQKLLQGMVHELLASQPADVIPFMTAYLQGHDKQGTAGANNALVPPPPASTAATEEPPLPDWASQPGLGDQEAPGFPTDGSAPLPDLSEHHNMMADLLREDPSVYDRLRRLQTPSGVALGHCIKTGIDYKGNHFVKTVGLVAGDEACYDVFQDLFEPVLSRLHGEYPVDAVHPDEVDLEEVTDEQIDPTGGRVISVQVRGSRNLSGLRMPPAMSLEERREVERLVSGALNAMGGALRGEYHPLRGSRSYAPKPLGMSEEEERVLRASQLLADPPGKSRLSAGLGRHWPQGRGVFVGGGKDFAVRLNERDHVKITSWQHGGGLQQAFKRFVEVEGEICKALRSRKHEFARSEHLGFLTACPSNLGTGLHLSVIVRLPYFSKRADDLKLFCRRLGVVIRKQGILDLEEEDYHGDVWELSCLQSLGYSAADQVNGLVDSCRQVVDVESDLQDGIEIDFDVASTAAYKSYESEAFVADQGFRADVCPDEMPDLAGRYSMVADLLRPNPAIYAELKDRKTPEGVTFARCVKTCFENNGHPMIKTIGCVAGDEMCYETFRELFDPVIQTRHPNFDPAEGQHVNELDYTKVSSTQMDPAGTRVVSVRACIKRNLRGVKFLPACSQDECRRVENVLVQACLAMGGDLKGAYYPLLGSNSYVPKPNGMSIAEDKWLTEKGFLFEKPDAQVQISSGFGRNWPDARGVFVGETEKNVVWINEVDHVRMTVTQPGSDLKEAFERLCRMHSSMEAHMEPFGHRFARSDRLGFLGTCPSQLGTCLVATATIRIPLLSAESKFRGLCKRLRLHAQLCHGHSAAARGLWDVLNCERLGSTEVEQVNTVIEGCRVLLELEADLELGKAANFDLEARSAAHSEAAAPSTSEEAVSFGEIPGLGSSAYPGFPVDACPDELPDLARHHNMMAAVLRSDSSIYTALKDRTTQRGVTFAQCIKTGVDNCGHPMIHSVGATAGDAECYELFAELFDPVVRRRHPRYDPQAGHITDLDFGKVSGGPVDAEGRYVVSVRVAASRNLRNLRMLPATSRQERAEVERVLTKALLHFTGDLEGEYLPLRQSGSYREKPGGMTADEESMLDKDGLLFQVPDSKYVLAAGTARDWPEARGVFVARQRNLAAWINEEDHLRLFSMQAGSDLKAAFRRFCLAESELLASLNQDSHEFAWQSSLGFLTTCPGNLGTSLRAEMRVRLPLLSMQPGFKALGKRLNVQFRSMCDAESTWDVSNIDRLGPSEVDQVNAVIGAVGLFVALESRLAAGEELVLDSFPVTIPEEGPGSQAASEDVPGSGAAPPAPESAAPGPGTKSSRHPSVLFSDIPGLGDTETPGFPTDECPETLPKLSDHHSLTADVLKRSPQIYDDLKGLRTSRGVCLAKCIKPGVDSRGHPLIRTVGAVAGDAECYDVFRELFGPIIKARRAGYLFAEGTEHITDLDAGKVSDVSADPSGKYLVSVRVAAARNLQDVRFPSAMSRDERCHVEGLATRALAELGGDLQGEYLPLCSSTSHRPRPCGMDVGEAAELEGHGLLFQEPEAVLRLTMGVGRHWPEARGVFVNAARSLAVWVNEEDHLRFTVTLPGNKLREAFELFGKVEDAVRVALQQEGSDYARSKSLGFLTTCPSKLGTGELKVSALVRLPLLGDQLDFKSTCRSLQVYARPMETEAWGSVWQVCSVGRLGQSEVELLNQVSAACQQLIGMEMKLEQGDTNAG